MYLIVTRNEYMAGLTKQLVVTVPYDSSDDGSGKPVTVTETDDVPLSFHLPFALDYTNSSHVFDVLVVHGDFPGSFVPSGAIQKATAFHLNCADLYTYRICKAVEKYIEECRIREQAEADAAPQSTNA